MYDLEQHIATWRRQMLAAGVQSPVPLGELEEHLRDEVSRLVATGLEPQAALAIAIEKIGPGQALKAEFTKAGVVKKSVGWEQRAVHVIWFFGILPLTIYALHKYDMSWGWRVAGLANISVITLSVLGNRSINALFPVIPNQRVRQTIGFSTAIAGMGGMILFMNFILTHFSLTEGPLTVLVLWGVTLMAMGGAVLTGLEAAATSDRRKR